MQSSSSKRKTVKNDSSIIIEGVRTKISCFFFLKCILEKQKKQKSKGSKKTLSLKQKLSFKSKVVKTAFLNIKKQQDYFFKSKLVMLDNLQIVFKCGKN